MKEITRFLSERGKNLRASEVRELLKWVKQGGIISFGGGMPDPSTFPVEEIREIFAEIFKDRKLGEEALQYGTTEGYKKLREYLLEMHKDLGFKYDSIDNVQITVGSQQALDLLGRVLIDPGDVVVVEGPSYLAAINAFSYYGAKFEVVPMDKQGIKVDLLEEKLKELRKKGEKVKFLYMVPTAQNPAGTTLPMDRRERVLELASEYDILVVEDNPYGYLLFEDVKIKHLGAMDEEERVIYMSTFSKILSPGFRLGFMIGNKDLIRRFALAKQTVDLCTPTITQVAAYEFLKRGYLEGHVQKIRKLYKAKRDKMLECLKKYMPKGAEWTEPIGGMFIWVTLPGIDTSEVVQKALHEKKVAYVHGRAFYPPGFKELGKNSMRLNFSYPSFEEIEEGVRRLGELFYELLEFSE